MIYSEYGSNESDDGGNSVGHSKCTFICEKKKAKQISHLIWKHKSTQNDPESGRGGDRR